MKPLPTELQEKIKEAKSWLLEGDQEKVAKRCNKSKVWVNLVMNGHAFNAEVVKAAIEVMNENKAMFDINTKMKVA